MELGTDAVVHFILRKQEDEPDLEKIYKSLITNQSSRSIFPNAVHRRFTVAMNPPHPL